MKMKMIGWVLFLFLGNIYTSALDKTNEVEIEGGLIEGMERSQSQITYSEVADRIRSESLLEGVELLNGLKRKNISGLDIAEMASENRAKKRQMEDTCAVSEENNEQGAKKLMDLKKRKKKVGFVPTDFESYLLMLDGKL